MSMDEGKRIVRERDRADMLAIMECVRKIRRLMDFTVVDFAAFCSLSFKAYYTAETEGSCSSYTFLRILRMLLSLDVRVDLLLSGGGFSPDMITERMREVAREHKSSRLRHDAKADFNRDFFSHLE